MSKITCLTGSSDIKAKGLTCVEYGGSSRDVCSTNLLTRIEILDGDEQPASALPKLLIVCCIIANII